MQPDSAPLSHEAALLLERLAWYNIVAAPRKRALLAHAKLSLSHQTQEADRKRFNTAFKRHLPGLQPLQSRHWA